MIDMAAEEVKSKAILADAGGHTNYANSDEDGDQPDRNPDTLPYSGDPSGTCPRCSRTSNFEQITECALVTQELPGAPQAVTMQRVVVLQCHGCGECTAVFEERQKAPAGARRNMAPVHWWPFPGADTSKMRGIVPDRMATMYEEGMRALSVQAPHAAAVMARGVLAFIVQERGSDEAKQQRNLYEKLKKMVDEGTIPPAFTDWVDVIRTTGNAGAHPDEYEEVSQDEAADRLSLAYGLIDQMYIQPDRVANMKRAHKAPKQ